MLEYILFLIVGVGISIGNRIELDVPSLPSSHWFELTSNNSQQLDRDALLGLIDGTSSSFSSSVLVRATYEQVHTERHISLSESDNKQQGTGKEPVLRGYLLTSSFNRTHPFVRVLVASAKGSYGDMSVQPICAVVTAVNGQNLYEAQACFVPPGTGHCLVIIPAMKMVQLGNKNQTNNRMELYMKLHHVASQNECLVDQTPKQDHIHHETRLGHAEFVDENIVSSTVTRSPVSIEYPIGLHFPGWYFSTKLKLLLSSTVQPSFVLRCRVSSPLSIHGIQTAVHTLSDYQITINYQLPIGQSVHEIDFNITIVSSSATQTKEAFEVDLSTVTFLINSTNYFNTTQPILPIDWFLLPNENEPVLSVPIQVQFDAIQTLVVLSDYTRLINTAMLSRQIQYFPLRIVTVNHSGHLQTISQAVCHSENVNLIQVDPTCAHIYFSGDERDDFEHSNSHTSIVVRYEKYLQRVHFMIFIPEYPLRIELSDSKLSRVHGWFVTNREGNDKQQSIIDDTDEDDDEEDDEEEDKCYPVYQQASIEVLTKFYRITENGDRIYLFNKLNAFVTSLVQAYLETENPRVAVIKNGRVIGLGPGKTNIRVSNLHQHDRLADVTQIMLQAYGFNNKFSIGSRTIQVDDQDLVQIRDVSFDLVTGIDLQSKTIEHIDSIYKVQLQTKPKLNRLNIDTPNQFGQLHIILFYSDNTSISLELIPSEHYQLNVFHDGRTSSLIRLDRSSLWTKFRVRSLAPGHGYLLGRLKMGQPQCTDDANLLQNDLSCEIIISSDDRLNLSPSQQEIDQYVLLRHAQPLPYRSKASPLLVSISILLGACVVLVMAAVLHWFISFRRRHQRRHSNNDQGRERLSTHSGAEEANQDWIFLDRNSLEMPPKRSSIPPVDPILHITSNPLTNTTLERQQELAELSHAQMVAYFDNLKESHA